MKREIGGETKGKKTELNEMQNKIFIVVVSTCNGRATMCDWG
jgi:hypothetical protein